MMINMAEEITEEIEETPVETFEVNYACLDVEQLFQTLNYLVYLKSNVFVDSESLPKFDLQWLKL